MVAHGARQRSVVLLGAGHTHLHVLKRWRAQGRSDATLTCISDYPIATYSGMLPGVLAGDYPPSAMEVPLAPLCQRAGADLVIGQVSALSWPDRHVVMSNGRRIAFDLLSVGVGSMPTTHGVDVAPDAAVVAVKPMQTFLSRLHAALQPPDHGVLRIATVGGGAAGVEIALCLPAFVARSTGADTSYSLVSDGPLLADGGRGLARRAIALLDQAGVHRVSGRVIAVQDGRLKMDTGDTAAADLVIWATGASPTPVGRLLGLPTDRAGFIATTETLQSLGSPHVFAVGDAGTIVGRDVPRAGVYAVRQGPVLLDNLRRALDGQPLRPFVPQPSFLKLLNAGNGRAVGEWRGVSFEGRWCRWLKDAIDTRFIASFQAP
ncbi:MAG: FAD-dependent oxidoreductase [Vicinamibacterales bacterium]